MGISLDDLNNNTIYLEATGTLAQRIDFAWSVYADKKHNNDDEKKKAFNFLMYAFDLHDITTANAELIQLMDERARYKTKNPEYIPGKQLTRLPFDPRGLILKAIAPEQRAPKTLTQALKSTELLDVNPQSKSDDANDDTVPYLSEEERASYRVNIHHGKFQKDWKNFDTSEMASHSKLGFAAFTLNANGELSVFIHQGYKMRHSSMNAGAPVVAAGELKIEDGALIAITTHSGHYMPSMFNIYRALEHFALHDVDIKHAHVITFNDPSTSLGITSTPIQAIRMYATDARHIYHAMNTLIEKNIHSLEAEIKAYQTSTSYNALLQFKDEKMGGNLTQKRLVLAEDFVKAIQDFKDTLPDGLSKPELHENLKALDAIISSFQQHNETLSSEHGKKQSSGRLAKKMTSFKKQLKTLQTDKEDNIKADVASHLKKLR